MVRLIGALMLVLLIVSPSFGQQSLVGTYKIVSHVAELGGTPIEPYGKAPHGYLVLTPTRAIAFFTGGNRKFGTSVDDKAALLDGLQDGQACIVLRGVSSSYAWMLLGSKTGMEKIRFVTGNYRAID